MYVTEPNKTPNWIKISFILALIGALALGKIFSRSNQSADEISSQSKQNNTEIPIETNIKKSIIGHWRLDSMLIKHNAYLQKNVKYMQNARLTKNGDVIECYQDKYLRQGDNVSMSEFDNFGKYIFGVQDDYSIKNSTSGVQTSSTDYIIIGDNIISTPYWGRYNENKNTLTYQIIHIDSAHLIYNFENNGQLEVHYFTKVN